MSNAYSKGATFLRWCLLMLFLVVMASLYSQFAGGDGTENNPWQIANAAHLNNVRNYLGEGHSEKHFVQTADINLGEAPWNENQGWQPIGFHIAWNNFAYFYGNYDGNGFRILNLTSNRNADYQGLFGYVEQGVIQSVVLDSVNVTGRQFVGALAGRNSGVIFHSSATGRVNGLANCNYVGGLVGYNYLGIIMTCWANVTVSGEGSNIGGLAGQNTVVGIISECYAAGNVTGNTNVGGLVGQNRSYIGNSYSVGRVMGNTNVGGLVGSQVQAEVENSYWDTETSRREQSAGGVGRTTMQMTVPATFNEWDFERIWQIIPEVTYPYLAVQDEAFDHNFPFGRIRPHPLTACFPFPVDDSTGVSVGIERLAWQYHHHNLYSNPLGFRVYLNTSGEFGEDDDYEWVAFQENETNYFCAAILPENLSYAQKYYWQVVPTANDPDDNRDNGNNPRRKARNRIVRDFATPRGDAQNCEVWSFTTQLNPRPATAINPNPADDSTGVSVYLEQLEWEYIVDTTRVNPLGFRVYMNTTGEFDDADEPYLWVTYVPGQTGYANAEILPMRLHYDTKHYWKVVPTTTDPEGEEGADAEHCPVWTFITQEPHPDPLPASNPFPAHQAENIPVTIDTLFWDYELDPAYINPAGFRVYLNTTGEFGEDDEYQWVVYNQEQIRFNCSSILPQELLYDTVYYWKVVPTTIEPDSKRSAVRRFTERHSYLRGDAEDCPVWTFTTEQDTYVSGKDAGGQPVIVFPNFPNPFNPETVISFQLSEPAEVTITIYNCRGQTLISLLENKLIQSGYHSFLWDGRDSYGKLSGSGQYFYRFESRNTAGRKYSITRKMLMLK